jgi:UTP-glucose-1-phosphate uridylyltransferase
MPRETPLSSEAAISTAARDTGMSRPIFVVVLAAGEGTRMRSSRPKPLHHLCGRPMVLYVLDAASHDDVRATVVVVGHGATWVEKALTERARADVHLTFVEQYEQLGTGHAVSVALPTIQDESGGADGDVLILPGRHATASCVDRGRTARPAPSEPGRADGVDRRRRRPVGIRAHRARKGRLLRAHH